MYSPAMISRMNEIANRYRGLIREAIFKVLSQTRYRNTGKGAESVVVTVTAGTATTAPIIEVKFDDHLVFLENGKMQWTKLPNMENLLEYGRTKAEDEKGARAIAWATALKQKNFDAWKPKKWRKKSLSEVLKEMNVLVLKEFDEAIEQDLQQAVTG